MDVDVSTSIIISRPLGEVASFSADPDNAPLWYENIKSVEWKTPRPLKIGSRVAFVAKFLGRHLAYTYEIVDWDPSRRLIMKTAEGPFPMETSYCWQATENGETHMVLRNYGSPTGFSKWAAPFIASAMRRASRRDLLRLKNLLELRLP